MRTPDPARKLIALFGVSGVGKSTLASRVAACWPDKVAHIAASDLLEQSESSGVASTDSVSVRDDILLRQSKVLQELERRANSDPGKVIILDGHSIIRSGHDLVEIPVAVVRALSPRAIIFAEDAPERILARRAADPARARAVLSLEQIAAEQALARSVCEKYSEILNVPLLVCPTDDVQPLKDLTHSMIREMGPSRL